MAIAPLSNAGRGPHPPQDEAEKSGSTPLPPTGEEITVEVERGPHPPQDQA